MLRMIGAGLLILAGILAGRRAGSLYARRPRELAGLIGALLLLQTEIAYAATPLAEALRAVAHRANPQVAGIFAKGASRLKASPGLTGAEVLVEVVKEIEPSMALKKEDWDTFRDLAAGLGNSDREDQQRYLTVAIERLKAAARLAEEDARRYAQLYSFFGPAVAIGITVLLW